MVRYNSKQVASITISLTKRKLVEGDLWKTVGMHVTEGRKFVTKGASGGMGTRSGSFSNNKGVDYS